MALQREDDPERDTYLIFSAARSAYDLAEEGLALFDERREAIAAVDAPHHDTPLIRAMMVRSAIDPQTDRRGLIGAQAFLGNLVILEKCVARLLKVSGLPAEIRSRAEAALITIRQVVDRDIRNATEHIDERILSAAAGETFISATILEVDLYCATDKDGTLKSIAVNRTTLEIVGAALNSVLWPNGLPERRA